MLRGSQAQRALLARMRPRLQLRQLGRVEAADRLQARKLRRQANVGEELDEAKLVVVGVVGVLGVGWVARGVERLLQGG